MQHARTFSCNGYTDLLDTMEMTTASLKAFASLLHGAIISKEPLENVAFGVITLLEQWCDDLEFLERALRKEFSRIKLEKLEVQDIDAVTGACGVSRKTAVNVLSFALGLPFSHFERREELA